MSRLVLNPNSMHPLSLPEDPNFGVGKCPGPLRLLALKPIDFPFSFDKPGSRAGGAGGTSRRVASTGHEGGPYPDR